MEKIERIVVTTDLSEASKTAFPWAEALAVRFNASVALLHAVDPMPMDYYKLFSEPDDPIQEKAATYAESLVTAMAAMGFERLQPEIHVVDNPVTHEAILRFAEESGADLIVMATHGRTGLADLLLGSTPERVVHHSSLPVLCVRCLPGPVPEEITVSRILCPVDLSDRSLAGFWAAATVARAFSATVDLLHVGPEEGQIRETDDSVPDPLLECLEQWLPEDQCGGLSIERHVARGRVPRTIIQAAHRLGDDLIVMATHGQDALEDYLIGSNTQRVLRHSDHPVLVCPAR